MKFLKFILVFMSVTSCASDTVIVVNNDNAPIVLDAVHVHSDSLNHYLALGDSYTIAESVPPEKSFPAQLVNCVNDSYDLNLEIIATTGWTTTELITALDYGTKRETYDLVTLLIGVNNQYQGKSFSIYKDEFLELLKRSIKLANNNANNVIVISIPDYAYTPYGQSVNTSKISEEIDTYNNFAKNTANNYGVTFVDITDITRQGIVDKELVADDGLHPSGKAYQKFVTRICPKAITILK